MHKKTKKVVCVILTLLLATIFFANIVHATSGFQASDFTTFDNAGNDSLDDSAKGIAGTAISVIQIVGAGVSIITITLVAIKYMMAAPEEKATYKKTATMYIVGAILVFGATSVLGIIEDFAKENI